MRRCGPADSAMVVSASTWAYLFFRLLLALLPDSWAYRACRHSARRRISSSRSSIDYCPCALLVCAVTAMDFERLAQAHVVVLGGDDRVDSAGGEFMATADAGHLFCLFSVVHFSGAGFFFLPVRRNAARSGIYLPVLSPPGLLPGLGGKHPPSRASLFLLQWEWLRIYFESGIAKLASGDPQWRNFTAMDEYYQNGPLPTWIGWYAQHLPHWFHDASVGATLVMELGFIWMILLPRRFRIVLFFTVTCWEAGVISTANYCFLNYLVLSLGVLLLDDRFLARFAPKKWKQQLPVLEPAAAVQEPLPASPSQAATEQSFLRPHFRAFKLAISAVMLTWVFYVTSVELLWMLAPHFPLPTTPVIMLEPFRIANQYGLFAVMTRGRYEI